MKKRSPLYPMRNLLDCRNYSVNVYEKIGDSTPLKYQDLAKHGKASASEAETLSSTSKQFGFMELIRGKGYVPVGSVCSVLRKPQDNEESEQYLAALSRPDIYQKIISEYNGKPIPPDGLDIFLIRKHQFSDNGAKQCTKVFLENANFLGLIGSSGVFNVKSEILITPPSEQKVIKDKETKNTVKIKSNTKVPKQNVPPVINKIEDNSGNGVSKTIMVFIKGQEFNWPVPNNMSQTDWDHLAKQIQQLKSYAK